jgi:hypothetical protein
MPEVAEALQDVAPNCVSGTRNETSVRSATRAEVIVMLGRWRCSRQVRVQVMGCVISAPSRIGWRMSDSMLSAA